MCWALQSDRVMAFGIFSVVAIVLLREQAHDPYVMCLWYLTTGDLISAGAFSMSFSPLENGEPACIPIALRSASPAPPQRGN